jgi:hypothetical protein
MLEKLGGSFHEKLEKIGADHGRNVGDTILQGRETATCRYTSVDTMNKGVSKKGNRHVFRYARLLHLFDEHTTTLFATPLRVVNEGTEKGIVFGMRVGVGICVGVIMEGGGRGGSGGLKNGLYHLRTDLVDVF